MRHALECDTLEKYFLLTDQQLTDELTFDFAKQRKK